MGGIPIHPWPVRLAHWVGAFSLFAMAGSGLQILGAYPYLGPRGDLAAWYPLAGWRPPSLVRVGGWLGGARAWHFTAAWTLLFAALVYAVFLALSGEWRARFFMPRRDASHAWQTLKGYLRLAPMPTPNPAITGAYNGLQRAAYSIAIILSFIEVLSGLVMWKPVQLSSLGWWMGGYDGARAIHLLGLFALGAFVAGHLIMVLAHPKTLFEMLGGGTRRPIEPVDLEPSSAARTQSADDPSSSTGKSIDG
ncbi:MAG: cytochrome b/b6 domain-containing protein [Polyangiaceae bacterium]